MRKPATLLTAGIAVAALGVILLVPGAIVAPPTGLDAPPGTNYRTTLVAIALLGLGAVIAFAATRPSRGAAGDFAAPGDPAESVRMHEGTLPTGIARDVLKAVSRDSETDEPFRELLGEIRRAFSATTAAILATTPGKDMPEILAATPAAVGRQYAGAIGSGRELEAVEGLEGVFRLSTGSDREYPTLAIALANQGQQFGHVVICSPMFEARADRWSVRVLDAASEVAGIVSGVQRARMDRRLLISEERSAIARELHDSLAQSLSYLKIQASRLQKLLDGRTPATELDRLEVDTIVEEFRSNLSLAYRQLRELITTCRLTMNGRDLGAALEESAEEFGRRSSVVIDLDNRIVGVRLRVDQELQVLHIVREALSNIVRHSHASHARVVLRRTGDRGVKLDIFDDGVGMSPGADQEKHYGLVIMQERARSLGGMMHLETRAEGGTRISVEFDQLTTPLPAPKF